METCRFRMSTQSVCVLIGVLAVGLNACATTKRAAQLAIDHQLGMVQGAWDIVTGEAESREQRIAKLHTDLETNRARIDVEQDQGRSVDLLRQQMLLQDALVAELMHSGHQGHGQQHASAEAQAPAPHHNEAPVE